MNGGNEPKRGGGLRRALASLIVALVILWVTVYFALRTPTGHDAVVARLQQALGRELTVGTTRLAPPLVLVAEQVASVDFVAGEQGVRADLLQIRLGFHPWLQVRVVRPEVNLIYDGSEWTPVSLAGLGELPGESLGGLSELCAAWRERATLTVEDGTFNWHRGLSNTDRIFTGDNQGNGVDQGDRAAFAEHADFMVCRVGLPQRAAWFHRLQVARAQGPQSPVVEAVRVEWLAVDSNRYVEIARSSSLPLAAGGFWGAGYDNTQGP